MRDVILSYIEKLILDIKLDLRDSPKNHKLVAKRRELERIKQEILFMSKHPEILNAKYYRIDETITNSSEIRLMDDCDTEDISLWAETTVKGDCIRLREGDLILKIK
ncbi:hypothetical protein [Prevotella sp. HUN102]|uniref:hypothetical protein n=1 Tax=Prevotella sp. HUN102 TaxID=1392486 RepID=UPI00048FCC64|nr:hypothetical protein [Prevotella sp. HUN102]